MTGLNLAYKYRSVYEVGGRQFIAVKAPTRERQMRGEAAILKVHGARPVFRITLRAR